MLDERLGAKNDNILKMVDMRDEYDFSKGTRGKYVKKFRNGTNVVVLAPDVSVAFPDSESVNSALRNLMKIASGAAKSKIGKKRKHA